MIEEKLERIATALEKINNALERISIKEKNDATPTIPTPPVPSDPEPQDKVDHGAIPPMPPMPQPNAVIQMSIDELNDALLVEYNRLGEDKTKIENVIKKYGASSLASLDPSKYSAVLEDVRGLK